MNIEKTISEQAVSDILTPMLESQDRIVTEDVAPLFDQATGLDTPPASGTVTTTIEESRSVITAIIRKAWTATLTMLGGASVISYIAAAYTYLRTRLQGNETYGIPDRRSEISASSPLAANLALLNDRKIGGADVPDGMSVAQLCCAGSIVDAVTEIIDNTTGWIMTRALPFKNIKGKVSIGCAKMIFYFSGYGDSRSSSPIFNAFNEMEELDTYDLDEMQNTYGNGTQMDIASNCPKLKKWNAPKFGKWNTSYIVHNCPNLEIVIWGTPQNDFVSAYGSYGANFTDSNSKMVHFEICADGGLLNRSFHLDWWNPSYVLSDNPTGTDLIEEGSTAQNNLQQFLENFRDHIANRLTDNGSGKTITLSQAVHNAITAAEDDYHIREIITQKGWTISPAPN